MIKCIAIDDEPLALKQIAGYINKTPFLELVGQFDSALQAMEALADTPVDLMFVDINMPDLSGMDFVKSLPHIGILRVKTRLLSLYMINSV